MPETQPQNQPAGNPGTTQPDNTKGANPAPPQQATPPTATATPNPPAAPQPQTPVAENTAAPEPKSQSEKLQKDEKKQDQAQTTDYFTKALAFLKGNKGIIIAVVIALIILIIGFKSIFSFGDTEEYRGLIQQVEQETNGDN